MKTFFWLKTRKWFKWNTIRGNTVYVLFSMTSLLTHTVAHSTRPSFMPKANNQPLKKFVSLSVSWVNFIYSERATKFCKILTLLLWPSQNIWTFIKSCQKLQNSDILETHFCYCIDIFWKPQFLNHSIF